MKLPEIVHVVSYDLSDYDEIRSIAKKWYEFKRNRDYGFYDTQLDRSFVTVRQREWIIDMLLDKLRQRDPGKRSTKKQINDGKWPEIDFRKKSKKAK